ncbi:leishmanolysin-like peptidase [Sycon ciliatum]|uniref:leishmanolysin-like peptidase n=1 Tax=Sycon ciliatum TaxID=27933 RepID=UPI0031F715B4
MCRAQCRPGTSALHFRRVVTVLLLWAYCFTCVVSLDESFRTRRQSTPAAHSLRVTFHQLSAANSTQLSAAQQGRLEAVLAASRDWALQTLTVLQPSSQPLRLNRACQGVVQYTPSASSNLRQYFCREPAACRNYTSCGPAIPQVPAEHLEKCQLCFLSRPTILSCDSDPNDVAADSPGLPSTDLVVYVVNRCDLVTDSGSLSYGSSCGLRYGPTDRPNAGWMAVCPDRLGLAKADLAYQVSEVQRQLIRILGVSSTEFAYWRDPVSNTALTPRGSQNEPVGPGPDNVASTTLAEVSQNGPGGNQRRYYELRTPAVLAEARRHFGCQSLTGMPMEDYANRSADLFEMRVAGPSELLTLRSFLPSTRLSPVVSRLTLSALADTGWYSVDYDRAFTLHHGSARGCAFVEDDCLSYVNTSMPNMSLVSYPHVNESVVSAFSAVSAAWATDPQPSSVAALPFCNIVRPSSTTTSSSSSTSSVAPFARCSASRQRITACNLVKTSTQHQGSAYTYFQDSDVQASADPASDYCPTFSPFLSNGSSSSSSSSSPSAGFVSLCDGISSAPAVNWALEQYSASSLCVEHSELWRRLPNDDSGVYQVQTEASDIRYYGAGCYRRECTADGSLRIWIGNVALKCQTVGQTIPFSLTINTIQYNGGIVCPSPSLFCAVSRCPGNCSWHGDCQLESGTRKCNCYAGYSGASCNHLVDGTAVDLTSASSANPDIGPPEPQYFTTRVIANISIASLVVFVGGLIAFLTQCVVPAINVRKVRREAHRRRNLQTQQVQSAGEMELQRINMNMRNADAIEVIDSTHGASYPRQPGFIPPPLGGYQRQHMASQSSDIQPKSSDEQLDIEITEEGVADAVAAGRDNGYPAGSSIELGPIQHHVTQPVPVVTSGGAAAQPAGSVV